MTNCAAPGFATMAIHAGAGPGPTTGAPATPIDQAPSCLLDGADHARHLFGQGMINPVAVLEERIAALEGGVAAVAAASGRAAQLVVFHMLMAPGEDIVAANKLDGGSIGQLSHAFKNFGWGVTWAAPDDPSAFAAAIGPKTKAISIESIGHPGGAIDDIEAIAQIAKAARIPLIVDNTLATPYLIRPIDYGADIVLHSSAKLLGGHGHCTGGLVIDGGGFDWLQDQRYPMLAAPRPEYQGMVLGKAFGNFSFAVACRVLGLRDFGAALSPFDAFLTLSGIETLPLRMQRHCENALAVAEYLAGHRAVRWVAYPALQGDRYHALAQKYCPNGAGALVAFGLQGDDAGGALVRRLQLFSRCAGVGGARALAVHLAATTLSSGAVHLSIGIEDKKDLIADLDQALAT
jgi:O-acetylhomoserine (thiol)-lyase